MRFHVDMGAQASIPPRAHVGPIPLLGGILGTIALGVVAAIVIAVCAVHIATSPSAPAGAGGAGFAPSQRPLNPGTYSAGTLSAPTRLGDLERLTVTQRSQVRLLRSQRDTLRHATGKPAIAAQYGRPGTFQVLPVALVASTGYVDPKHYLGTVSSGRVMFSAQGPDQCATYDNLAVICVRSDRHKQLTVVVEGTPPFVHSAHSAAALVDDGWRKLS